MTRLKITLAAFLILLSAGTARAASTIDSLGPAIFPLADPATLAPGENAWISQNGGDFHIPVTQLGYILQAPAAPLNPFIYQLWWDNSVIPQVLRVYSGTGWAVVGSFDRTNTLWVPPIGGGILPTIASAATTDLGSVPEGALNVSGAAAITSFGSSAIPGVLKFVVFTGAATLVENGTSMILPGVVNITTSAGDALVALSLGGGNWKIVNYTAASGACLVSHGCTGQTTLTAHAVLLGEATAPIGFAVPGTAGYPLLSIGALADPAFGQLNLAGAGVTGTLPLADLPVIDVPHGGTGDATLTAHAVLLGEGTAPIGFAAPGTAGYPLISTGSTTDPAFSQLNLAGAGVTGTLPLANFPVVDVPHGGTGDSTLPQFAVLLGNGTGAVQSAAPSTAGTVLTSNGASAFPSFQPLLRRELTGDTSFYVATTGNDANDCASPGTACATLQRVWNLISTLDFLGFGVAVHIADGSYSGLVANGTLTGAVAGASAAVFDGNGGNPSLVMITGSDAVLASAGAVFTIEGVELIGSGSPPSAGYGLAVTSGASVVFNNVIFGPSNAAQITANTGGAVRTPLVGGIYKINGSAANHVAAAAGGSVILTGSAVTVTGNPTYSSSFALAIDLGSVTANGMSFTGTAVGTRYFSSMNGIIDTATGANNVDNSYFPGTINGSSTLGGQYN